MLAIIKSCMNKQRIKDALASILIGAIVAFVTVFLEGALDYFRGLENNVVGGMVATLTYISRHLT